VGVQEASRQDTTVSWSIDLVDIFGKAFNLQGLALSEVRTTAYNLYKNSDSIEDLQCI
jgi:hypothetical protein